MLYDEIKSNKRKSILLVFLFFIILIILGYFIGAFFFNPYFGIVFAAIISIIMTLISLYTGDKILIKMTQAKEAKRPEHTYLINTVEGLSIAAGIPKPSIYVIEDSAINAFATGRNPNHAAVTVTTGAIEKLSREELEGVIAHEISHITNYDIRFMMLVATLVGITVLLSDLFLRSIFYGNFRDRNNRAGAFVIILGLILAILTPIIVQLIRLAVSRQREFLADSSGASLTRYPLGLANALRKIRDDKEPLIEGANRAVASLFIENPLRQFRAKTSNLWNTHPNINERITRLESY